MLIFKIIAVSFLTLSVVAGIVLLSLPLGIPQQAGMFLWRPERTLWLLFILGLVSGLVLFALGSSKRLRRSLSKAGGGVLMVLGFVSAMEIFLIKAQGTAATSTNSLWWLAVVATITGALGVYLPESAQRREREAEEVRARRAALEAKVPARENERRMGVRVVRLSQRR